MKEAIKYIAIGFIVIILISLIGFKIADWKVNGPDSERIDKLFPELFEGNVTEDEGQNLIQPDDCIFDQQTQTDEFLKNIAEFDGYYWDKDSKTAEIPLDRGDYLLITRGGCYHFGVSAEFRLRNDTTDYSDWQNVYDKVLWIAKILDSEFKFNMIKNDLDSNLITINKMEQGDTLYFSNEYLKDNNYSIDREIQKGLVVLRLGYYN